MPFILLVEDDPTQRLLTASVLRKAGHEVQEATNAADAIAAATARVPDAIVCDVVMPGCNGYEFVETLRRDPALGTVPVVLLTAMGSRSHMRIGMTAGADDYLAKPFVASELIAAVDTLVGKERRRREQFANDAEGRLRAALKDQHQTLARRYERELRRELDGRWAGEADAAGWVDLDPAVMLLADLAAYGLGRGIGGATMAPLVQRLHRSAHDTLYLFGARYLLPSARGVLAVFSRGDDKTAVDPRIAALRAAFALRQAAQPIYAAIPAPPNTAPTGPTISVHEGPVTLVRVSDPLHGGEPRLVVTGDALHALSRLADHAASAGWQVACDAALARRAGSVASIGRRDRLPVPGGPAVDAVEMLGLRSGETAPRAR